jgi:hypothetical protein
MCQTGQHLQVIGTGSEKTGYSHRMGHSCGSLGKPLQVINMHGKGPYISNLERSHIYRAKQIGFVLNDTHTDTHKPIFEFMIDLPSLGSGRPNH